MDPATRVPREQINTSIENLRAVVYYLVMHQYEDGFKQVADIDNLSDKIIGAVEMFLDIEPNL